MRLPHINDGVEFPSRPTIAESTGAVGVAPGIVSVLGFIGLWILWFHVCDGGLCWFAVIASAVVMFCVFASWTVEQKKADSPKVEAWTKYQAGLDAAAVVARKNWLPVAKWWQEGGKIHVLCFSGDKPYALVFDNAYVRRTHSTVRAIRFTEFSYDESGDGNGYFGYRAELTDPTFTVAPPFTAAISDYVATALQLTPSESHPVAAETPAEISVQSALGRVGELLGGDTTEGDIQAAIQILQQLSERETILPEAQGEIRSFIEQLGQMKHRHDALAITTALRQLREKLTPEDTLTSARLEVASLSHSPGSN